MVGCEGGGGRDGRQVQARTPEELGGPSGGGGRVRRRRHRRSFPARLSDTTPRLPSKIRGGGEKKNELEVGPGGSSQFCGREVIIKKDWWENALPFYFYFQKKKKTKKQNQNNSTENSHQGTKHTPPIARNLLNRVMLDLLHGRRRSSPTKTSPLPMKQHLQ